MPKFALCMSAANAPASVQKVREEGRDHIFRDFHLLYDVLSQTQLSMQNRATCETDPSFLQLIPYITVVDDNERIFCYSRGQGSAEERLQGKLSIGLGGHVDSLPDKSTGLVRHLQEEGARELEEEIGLVVDPQSIRLNALLVAASTPVDIVHLGIHCVYRMKPTDRSLQHEAGVIEKGEFLTRDDLLLTKFYDRMEGWSKLVLGRQN